MLDLPGSNEGLAWIAAHDPARLMLHPGCQAASIVAAAAGHPAALACLRFTAQHYHATSAVSSRDSIGAFCQAAALSSSKLQPDTLQQQLRVDPQRVDHQEQMQLKDAEPNSAQEPGTNPRKKARVDPEAAQHGPEPSEDAQKQAKRQTEAAQQVQQVQQLRHLLGSREGHTRQVLEQAAEAGHVGAIKWLLALCPASALTGGLMAAAAAAGQLAVLQFLGSGPCAGTWGSDIALAAIEHPEAFKWLATHQDDELHPSIVPILISTFDEDMLRWLESNLPDERIALNQQQLRAIISNGHLGMLQFFSPRLNASQHAKCAKLAAQHGHLAMVRWLMSQGTSAIPPWWRSDIVTAAIQGGSMPMLEYLFTRLPRSSMADDLCSQAIKHRRDDMLRHMRALDPPVPWDDQCVGEAVKRGDVELIQWLRSQTPPAPLSLGCTEAASEYGHLDVLIWLHENEDIQAQLNHIPPMTAVRGTGDIAVLDWLCSHGCRAGPLMYWLAVKHQHPQVLKWLHQHGIAPCDPTYLRLGEDWSVPAIMFMGDIGARLPADARRSLVLARKTFCTFHGLLRWCARAVGDPSRNAAKAFDYLSPSSTGQGLLTRLALLPPDLITKIAIAAQLQHDLLD